MNENEHRPSEDPYGSQPPTNPYGQPLPSSSEQPPGQHSQQPPAEGSADHDPYPSPHAPQSSGPGRPNPYGQPAQPYGQPPQAYGQPPQAYGQPPQQPAYGSGPYGSSPYGSSPYGGAYDTRGDARPGTVTTAGWITIVLGVLGILGNLFFALMVALGQDFVADAIQSDPGFQSSGVSIDAIVGITLALFVGLAVWSGINVLLGVLVLRRSNVARILLVISCAITALLSLALIASGVTAVSLLAAVAVVVLLFVGGAGDWFARRSPAAYGGPHQGSPYGGSPYGNDDHDPR